MGEASFSIVIHNHQPVDNPDGIIESIYRRAYLPFVQKLAEFPEVKANLHYTGYLLEWLEARHPEIIRLLRNMVDEGQVEMIGGGYYEPILATIPDQDAIGQVLLESRKLWSLFGRRPTGAWMAERAWEPQSPELLRSCGVRYTMLDDTIFARAGIPERETHQPFEVESRGSKVTVVAMSKVLRYSIPWKNPSATIKYLKRASRGASPLVVFGDDGEKFGAWPTTYEMVYQDGWLGKFFEEVAKSKRWLRPTTLSKHLSLSRRRRTAYLPAASYDELMEWSLPAGRKPDGAMGYWRLFLAKYPESRRLYSKMLSVSAAVDRMGRGQVARNELWKAQFNDVYWHGVFGGIYSPALRRIAYHHLLAAQRAAESHLGRRPWARIDKVAVEGQTELSVQTRDLSLRVCPEAGGSMAEFGVKEAGLNLLDVVARRKESYHGRVKQVATKASVGPRSIHDVVGTGDARLRTLLVHDRYPRYSFLDHLVSPATNAESFRDQTFSEFAPLSGSPYLARAGVSGGRATVELSKGLAGGGKVFKYMSVNAAGASVSVSYRLSFPTAPPRARFLVEVNLASLGDERFSGDFSATRVRRQVDSAEANYASLGYSAKLEFSRPVDLWAVPVETVSRSESGFAGVLQGVALVPSVRITDQETTLGVTLSARSSG